MNRDNKKKWIVGVAIIIIFSIYQLVSMAYERYEIDVASLFVTVVEDVDRYEIVPIDDENARPIEIKTSDLYPVDERDSYAGYPNGFTWDSVRFDKKDFKRVYEVKMYQEDNLVLTAYLAEMMKKTDRVENFKIYLEGRKTFYDINGHYYALETKGRYWLFTEGQSSRLSDYLKAYDSSN